MRYLDASAIVKLAVAEVESNALIKHLTEHPDSLHVTSAVARTEVAIAIARKGGSPAEFIADEAGTFHLRGVSLRLLDVLPAVATTAAALGARLHLRALDAIHVATARALDPDLTEVLTYDKRMISACEVLGMRVASPGA